jgi:hypothetical protein
MAYERTNWQNGDVISSEKLNKMEAGIEYACSLEHEVEDPTEGQVLKYDAEKEKFVNADVPAAIETNIQNPTDGQTLKYDAASGKWVNGEGGSGSSTLVVNMTYDGSTSNKIMDKTWQEIYDAFPNVYVQYNTSGIGSSFEKCSILNIISTESLDSTGYNLFISMGNITGQFTAATPQDYPVSGGL